MAKDGPRRGSTQSLPQPRELHDSFPVGPLVADLVLGLGAEVALAGHRAPVDAVVCHRVNDEVFRWSVARWRHVAVRVLGGAGKRQVDAALFFDRQRLDAWVAHYET